ncbi:MAG: phage tail sheath subtilisin-like domain-containing protein [Candidatus Thiodiazotropha taylori]|uniref:Phage tail sheath subtilisin-like domain-containing protein n=1 Tax=Candidatus Thiodiazotropha taylori TaxID=2792791 RepID=A0A9E4N2L5_9GAMM|nr:phage tail sheath subtilisin-like domain-containing protein [Candidatus Thiodiazotropha taylori]MCW4255038.1 phage tail sheath subtilisin-like domain-containing protein [Candidatus Thiodiazotropha taylori]
MAFLVSPGVEITERDLTNIIPAVSTSTGAFAGVFEWGPAEEATKVSSESVLISQFGYPRRADRNSTAVSYTGSTGSWSPRTDWFTAANFLDYSNDLRLVRILPTGARNAASEAHTGTADTISITFTPEDIEAQAAFYEDVTYDAIHYTADQEMDVTVNKAYSATLDQSRAKDASVIAGDSDVIIKIKAKVDEDLVAAGETAAADDFIGKDGKIIIQDAWRDATTGVLDATNAIYTIVKGARDSVITDETTALNDYPATNEWAIDSDTVRTQLGLTDPNTLTATDSDSSGTIDDTEAAELQARKDSLKAANDVKITFEILKRKAFYAAQYIDSDKNTHGVLTDDAVDSEMHNAGVRPIDSDTYDTDRSLLIEDSGSVFNTYLLDPVEEKAWRAAWYDYRKAEIRKRLELYAAMVDERMQESFVKRMAKAAKEELESRGIINVVYTEESAWNPAAAVITYPKQQGANTLVVPTTDVTENDSTGTNKVAVTYSEAPGIEAGVDFYTENVIKNEDHFLNTKESLKNGSVHARWAGKIGSSIGVVLMDAGISDSDFKNTPLFGNVTGQSLFDTRPTTSVRGETNHSVNLHDEVHAIVYTTDTKLTGVENDVLEVYPYLSKDKAGKSADGAANYYEDAINNGSDWIWIINEEDHATNAVVDSDGLGNQAISIGSELLFKNEGVFKKFVTNTNIEGVRKYNLRGGTDGKEISDADVIGGMDLFSDVETLDVSFVLTGAYSKNVQKHAISLCEDRKDCIAVISPDYTSAVTKATAVAVTDYFNNSTDGFNSSSYAVFDSGWKRQYDRHNDEYFWIPLNADIAGLMARTDYTNDPWWSPAGLNRGFIQNVVKLSFNPDQSDRDDLYTQRVNPVVTFRGQGTLLYGDKTALSRPSAFDRINVRRLFIVLEKAIATASKYYLFEFNDDFTRRSFVNAVEPYLNTVRTRRGVTDFRVVCDETNNTAEIVDSNRFVADIYIKPNRSINFVTLNFVAVRSGVSFNEIVG